MKIAIFTDTFLPQTNGVVTVVKTHAQELTKKGHKVIIFTAQPKKTQKQKLLEEFKGKNIKIYFISSFELPTYKDMRVATPTWIKSYWIMKKFNPDIIHSHTNFGVGWEAINCAKLLGVPMVGHHHTFWTDYLHHIKLDKEFMKKLTHYYTASYYNRCGIVITPSQSLKDELRQNRVKKPIKVMTNSIDVDKLKVHANKDTLKKKLGLSDNNIILYFGRVSLEKSIDVLLSAFKLISQADKQTKLFIVGDGPSLKDLKAQAKKLGISKNVIFTGMLTGKKLLETVAAADIFASASTSENQPMTFLEAMALGLPMVGADAKGVPEIIVNGKNGILFKPNSQKELAECLKKLLEDEALRIKMGAKSAIFAEKYSNDKNIKELIQTYKKLIKDKNEAKSSSKSRI